MDVGCFEEAWKNNIGMILEETIHLNVQGGREWDILWDNSDPDYSHLKSEFEESVDTACEIEYKIEEDSDKMNVYT